MICHSIETDGQLITLSPRILMLAFNVSGTNFDNVLGAIRVV